MSSNEVVHDDVVEQILIRLDVKDLIRYKTVCKSWHSLITSPRFINCHLNHSYNKDHCNNELGHRRFILANSLSSSIDLVGSSNGLICISSYNRFKLLVGNPLTREVRQITLPYRTIVPSFWGFGYDSSSEDYKVVFGYQKAGRSEFGTYFKVFSLKLNVWRVIREVDYEFFTKVGILFNGALHWIVKDVEEKKTLIVSYDFFNEGFEEIPLPDEVESHAFKSHLGIVKEGLCIILRHGNDNSCVDNVWLLKTYKGKQSWELVLHDHEENYDIVHSLESPTNETFANYKTWEHIDAPIFVESLVSPHVNGKPIPIQKLTQTCDNQRSDKELINQVYSFSSWIKCLSSCLRSNDKRCVN